MPLHFKPDSRMPSPPDCPVSRFIHLPQMEAWKSTAPLPHTPPSIHSQSHFYGKPHSTFTHFSPFFTGPPSHLFYLEQPPAHLPPLLTLGQPPHSSHGTRTSVQRALLTMPSGSDGPQEDSSLHVA